jgi:site-specific recombinase XerD
MESTHAHSQFANPLTWQEAVEDFLLQTRGSREENTERYYTERLKLLVRWAEGEGITLADFRARHLRQYLAHRADLGVSDSTRRSDAVSARAFLKFCKREEYIEADPLVGYQVPKAGKPYVKCPSDEEIRRLLQALQDRWKPSLNPKIRYIHASARIFYSRRNYAVVAGLIETAARIGEILGLKIEDYQRDQQQIAIRKTKGDEPRIVPISPCWMETIDAYLRVRPKVESDALFINEYGEPLTTAEFGRIFRGYLRYAGLSGFSLHGLRHYAITQLAKTDLWAASIIAGHKDLKVTRGYLHGDPVHVRSAHAQAAPLGRILLTTRTNTQRRKKVV